ncbi:MAG: hypothetical protein PHY93_18200 [Bacteriovorax sp.]|nr:hypothetical protein [Bacteriovorax sp.]
MTKTSLLKATLYLGAIILLLITSISFNSLNILTYNNAKTMRVVQDRFKLDAIELQIKEAIKNNPKDQRFSQRRIQNIDESLIRFEQQLKAGKFPTSENIKQKWDQVKSQLAPDTSKIINELEQLHRVVNTNILDDSARRIAVNERDVSHLKILKIANGTLIIILVFIAMYLDTTQCKQKEELLKTTIQDYEKKELESSVPK